MKRNGSQIASACQPDGTCACSIELTAIKVSLLPRSLQQSHEAHVSSAPGRTK
jgi:hypothetical protein